MQRRVTQSDIAKRLGLDKSTVSLALRNNPGIAKQTKERVQAMAEQMGYRPDPALATLARQRWAGHETGSGSALVYLVDSRMQNFSTQKRFFPAAQLRAESRGYQLNEFDLADYPNIKAVDRVLYNRGIRGVLVPQFSHTAGPGVLDLPGEHFTFVCLDIGWVPVPFNIVAPDVFETTRLVWKQVVDRGYKRIGGAILSHTPRAVDDATRYGASVASIEEWIPPEERIPILNSDIMDRDAFLRWFEANQPDAVIGFICRVYEWILDAGLKVPEDVAFASLGIVQREYPHVSGALRQEENIGIGGVDALIASMNENEWGIPAVQRKLLIEPTWQEGVTLPALHSSLP